MIPGPKWETRKSWSRWSSIGVQLSSCPVGMNQDGVWCTEVTPAGLKKMLYFTQEGTLNFPPQHLRSPLRCEQQDGCWQVVWCSCLNWYALLLRCNFQRCRQLGSLSSSLGDLGYMMWRLEGKKLDRLSIFKALRHYLRYLLSSILSLNVKCPWTGTLEGKTFFLTNDLPG